MKIKDIIGMYVFAEDKTTNEIIRIHVKDFGNRPQPNADLEYKNGKYFCKTVTVDEDCIGGACPIK